MPKRQTFWSCPEVLDQLHLLTLAHPGSTGVAGLHAVRSMLTRPYRGRAGEQGMRYERADTEVCWGLGYILR